MNYEIYADVMLLTSSIINYATYQATAMLTHQNIRKKVILIYSVLTALGTTVIEILRPFDNILIQNILYAVFFMIMTAILFRLRALSRLILLSSATVLAAVLIYGSSNILKHGIYRLSDIIYFLLIPPVMRLIYSCPIEKSNSTYQINIYINGSYIGTNAFYDTGNTLMYNHKRPVSIISPDVFLKLFKLQDKALLDAYLNDCFFDYNEMYEKTGILFHPVTYKTIDSGLSVMPVFEVSMLEFTVSGACYRNVLCGIARYTLENKNNYQVLLNSKIKPY